ncbi:MAG: tetratricopeptide repeat protein [Melioribacteraceae bacterium]
MKKQILILLSIFFALIINLSAQSVSDGEKAIKNKEYDKALAIAKQFIDANNTADAFKLLIPLEQKEFKDKRLFEYFGDAYAKMNVGENAINYYAKAEAMDSLDIPLKFKVAELLTKAERYTEAVNKYLKIALIDPNNSEAFLEGATILYKAKLYADAAIMFEKYLAIKQTEDEYLKITRAYMEIRNYEKTYNYALEGLTKFPGNLTLTKNAAIASLGLQKYEEAGKYYLAVPDSMMSVSDLKNAGRVFQQIKADSTAIKFFERVVQKDSTQSSLFMDMANNYFRNKNDTLAIKYYKAKIAVDPTYEPAHRYMGFAYYDMKDWDGARQALLGAKALVDTTFMTNYYLALAYAQMDSTEQMAEQYSTVLRLAEGKEKQYKDYIMEAVANLGQRAFKMKNYNAAVTYYRRANQLKPNDWRYMESLGACYQILQNYDEAIKWYCATLKINPKSEPARKGLRMMSADDCIPKNGK